MSGFSICHPLHFIRHFAHSATKSAICSVNANPWLQVALDDPSTLMRIWFNIPDVHHPHRKARPASTSLSSGVASRAYIRRLLPLQSPEGRPCVGTHQSPLSPLDLACAQLYESDANLATSSATNSRGSKRVTGGVCACSCVFVIEVEQYLVLF
jgi:hypothetical protein